MKTLSLLVALLLTIGLSTQAYAIGYPHRLFAAKKVAKATPSGLRKVGQTSQAPITHRAWSLPSVDRIVRVVARF
jgi:hypothetical protein